nr:uncharacterized mitochondrial protein AtMg00810-like [Tanacetum cinerariifolium]
KLQEEGESHVQAKDVQAKDVQAKRIQYIKRYHGYKKKPQSESEACKNIIAYEMEKEEKEIIKSINETLVQKAAKRRRLREQAKEAEDLKKQLEVVVDEDDDVFIKATPISRKVPVVNYEIVMINNKPRPKENTKCVSAAGEELTATKHKKSRYRMKKLTQYLESQILHHSVIHAVPKTTEPVKAEAVNTACYVQNRVLVIKPHNKTSYEVFLGRKPALSFIRPFRCPVTILNTLDHLGKFDGKADEGFFIRYPTNNKAFKVFNYRTKIVEENLYVRFNENTPNITGSGPTWLFYIDTLTKSMNYKPVVAGNQSNGSAGTKACDDVGTARVETVPNKDYILLPLWTQGLLFSSSSKYSLDTGFKPLGEAEKKGAEDLGNKDCDVQSPENLRIHQAKDANVNITNNITTVSPPVNAANIEDNSIDENTVYGCVDDLNMPNLEDIVYSEDDEYVGAKADMTNLDSNIHETCTEFDKIMPKKFQMSSMGELIFFLGLQVTQKDDGIFIRRDKNLDKILNKFGFLTVKTASTRMETSKPLIKDENAKDVDVHLHRSKISSLMYLTSSRPDIMFVVCACARFQVTPKALHLHAVKRIFKYLKGQPKLCLWYPKDLLFELEAYTDSDYAGASLDRESTTRGCQFLKRRLISWQCKKQIVVANYTTEAEYVAASSCYGQVLWIQNQLLDYGFNFITPRFSLTMKALSA